MYSPHPQPFKVARKKRKGKSIKDCKVSIFSIIVLPNGDPVLFSLYQKIHGA